MASRHFSLAALILGLFLAACADHNGQPPIVASGPNNPPPPTTSGDNQVLTSPGQGTSQSTGTQQPEGGGPPSGGGQPVPEPTTMLLVGTGLAGAALLARRRRQRTV